MTILEKKMCAFIRTLWQTQSMPETVESIVQLNLLFMTVIENRRLADAYLKAIGYVLEFDEETIEEIKVKNDYYKLKEGN